MAPFVVLAAVTALARLLGWFIDVTWLDSWSDAVRFGLATMFGLTASAHFLQPRRSALIEMVPPQLPAAPALVTLTGVLEIAGAVGLLIPATADLAAAGLAALLVVMFPANVLAARKGVGAKTMPLPLRTVLQVVFLGATALVIAG
ncbi:Uncharacterized membrane protein [Nocardia amikacinitolerans]|uniref:Uncharacterized membrane protein n=1 Tax=Nocardia amikacinitolerans TaxID=756689 RepID=A0A285LTQ3_9NOCA|nr:DoxX family protein [Nocardia amikacinitolerans]SNY88310.1 Uncharacterized membrane protein [Nocardia amikacinitolerans]